MSKFGKVIYTSGTFDLFHYGHLNILKKAKEMGTLLIVGVSTDQLVESYKGIKPTVCYKDRIAIIKELKCVDIVLKQTSFFNYRQLRKYNIDTIVLGDDWKNKKFNELDIIVKKLQIKVVYIPYTSRLSTSQIKESIIRNSVNIIKAQSKRSK